MNSGNSVIKEKHMGWYNITGTHPRHQFWS